MNPSLTFRLIFSLVAAWSLGPAVAAQERAVRVEATANKTWAIVIGVEQYQAAPRLECAVRDAEQFAETLVKVGRFDPAQILLITDKTPKKPDHATLTQEIPRWLAKVSQHDTLLLFFSGHGLCSTANGPMFLAPSNCRLEDLEHSAIGIAGLRSQLSGCPAANKILILDCCHAGAMKGESLDGERLTKALGDVRGLVTLASCRANQVSLEWKEKGQGLFSYWLIRGLAGEADLVRDGRVDVDELYGYVCQKVPQSAEEHFGVRQMPVRSIGPDVEGVPVVLSLPASSQPNVAPPPFRPSTEAASLPYHEDFQQVQIGALPQGWSGDAAVGVRREAGQSWLQAASQGMHRVQSGLLDISGNFRLELRVLLESRARFEAILEGADGSPDLTITVAITTGNARFWEISMTGATAQDLKVWGDRPNRIRLNRDGDVYQLIVNDKTLIAQRMPEHRRFQRLAFALSGPNSMSYIRSLTQLLEVELAPLGTQSQMPKGESGVIRVQLPQAPTRLGIHGADGGSGTSGVVILSVDPDSPAAEAGLAYGQTITHIDNQPVRNFQELAQQFAHARSRGSITITTKTHLGMSRTVEVTW